MSCENVRVARNYSPIAMAPANSMKVATMHAFLSEITPEPTEVPKQFATSFAPIPKLRTNAITKPTTSTQTTVEVSGKQSVQPNVELRMSSVVDSIFPETD